MSSSVLQSTRPDTGAAAASPARLSRSLSLADLIIYGLVFIGPIAPFVFYGYISSVAKGMVALAYLVGAIAMFFTAYSYKLLSADFPLAGSVYAYARRAIGERIGFVAGWMLVLDYILIPAGVNLAAANAIHDAVNEVPRWALAIGFIGMGTIINYVAVQVAAIVNKIILLAQVALLAAFMVIGLYALQHGVGAGHLTLKPLYQPGAFSMRVVFSAVSLAAIAFLGFDAISTLAEEVKGDNKRAVGRATMVTLVLAGVLFVAQTWIAADLANGMAFASPDTAFYEIAEIAGGKTFSMITAAVTALSFSLSSATVVQATIARLLFAMARDGRMPAFMTAVHPKFKTPYRSVLFVSAVSVVICLVFLNHFEVLGTLVNFGALSGFLILHATVVVHFMVRRRSRAYIRHLVCPVIGFVILAYVLYYMAPVAWELGVGWLVLGLLGYGVFSRKFRLPEPATVEKITEV